MIIVLVQYTFNNIDEDWECFLFSAIEGCPFWRFQRFTRISEEIIDLTWYAVALTGYDPQYTRLGL